MKDKDCGHTMKVMEYITTTFYCEKCGYWKEVKAQKDLKEEIK